MSGHVYARGQLCGHVCTLKRTQCWYAIEIDIWGAGLDWALGSEGEGGVLGDPVCIIFGHSCAIYIQLPSCASIPRSSLESLAALISLPFLPQCLSS